MQTVESANQVDGYLLHELRELGSEITLYIAGIILCMGSANEKRRYNVTASLIGWVYTQNGSCFVSSIR